MAQLFQNTIASTNGTISGKTALLNPSRIRTTSDAGSNQALVIYNKSKQKDGPTHKIVIDDTLANVSAQLVNYYPGRYVSLLIEEKNSTIIGKTADIAVDNIVLCEANATASSKTDVELSNGDTLLINQTLANFLIAVNDVGTANAVQVQSHTVTSGEESSGIIAGLTNMTTVEKVEDQNGIKVKMTLSPADTLTTIPPQILNEGDILKILYT